MINFCNKVHLPFSVLFIFICLFLLPACERDQSILHSSTENNYQYFGYDSSGVLIIRGWLYLHFTSAGQIEGDWDFKKVSEQPNLGPQIGQGHLVGSVNDSTFWINLNPNFADNNVFLNGIFKKDTLKGQWMYSTFVGATNWGKFTAIR